MLRITALLASLALTTEATQLQTQHEGSLMEEQLAFAQLEWWESNRGPTIEDPDEEVEEDAGDEDADGDDDDGLALAQKKSPKP